MKNNMVAFVSSVKTQHSPRNITVKAFLTDIKGDKYKAIIEELRLLTEEEYKIAKLKLPAVIVGGTFEGGVKNGNFKESSGIIPIDIDKLEVAALKEVREILQDLSYMAFIFTSPSGRGLKGGVRVPTDDIKTDEDFKRYFRKIRETLGGLGVELDESGKNVGRLCFVSWDPDVYINYDCDEFFVPWYDLAGDYEKTCGEAIGAKNGHKRSFMDNAYPMGSGEKAAIISRICNIILQASPGDRHANSVKAGRTAGGYIASGALTREDILCPLLDVRASVSDNGKLEKKERQAIIDGIEYGMKDPIAVEAVGAPNGLDATMATISAEWFTTSYNGKFKVVHESIVKNVFGIEELKHERFGKRDAIDLCANKTKVQVGETAQGAPKYANPMAVWLDSEHRRHYRRVVFDPRGKYEDAVYNTWRGFACGAKENSKILDGIHYHIEHIFCKDDPVLIKYFYDWVARSFQHPEIMAGTAIVVRGEKGAGKGQVAQLLLRIWGVHGVHVTNPEHLIGKFNSHLTDRCFVFADEAFYSGDKRHEGVLKTLVTERTMLVERKGIDAESVPSFLKVFMATNSEYAVPASRTERRWAVFDISSEKCNDGKYFSALAKDINNPEVQSAFLYEMLNRDISGYDAFSVPDSQGLRDQKLHTLPTVGEWFHDCLERRGFTDGLEEGAPWPEEYKVADAYASYKDWCQEHKIGRHEIKGRYMFSAYINKIFKHVSRGKYHTPWFCWGPIEDAKAAFKDGTGI